MIRVFEEKFLASDRAEIIMDLQAAGLKDVLGPDAEAVINQLHSNPRKLREVAVAYTDAAYHAPFVADMTPKETVIIRNDMLNTVDSLRSRGGQPMYVST